MPDSWVPAAAALSPLEQLFLREGQPEYELPSELGNLYGGPFGLPSPILYSNFVSSLDGVAVVGPSSGSKLSGNSQADRFVMGLLRACSQAILIGSGTLEGSPGHVWTADHVFPPLRERYRELRRRLGLPERPVLVIATGSGRVDLDHPGLAQPALLLTSDQGRQRLAGASHHQVVALGPNPELDPRQIVEAIRQAGHQVILTEGGPRLHGQLLGAGQVGQLFLTVAPLLAGRTKEDRRPGFVDGLDLLGGSRSPGLSLLSARRQGSHLFLRYLVEGAEK
ncbi:MAG TPA: dihydrofolate reductase family protein [Candidatus Dormibacteraeota bacterium]|nr:dihydrofolate reductase family protein [Candidatus Dormibacteraeota bacterium]